MYTFVNFPQIYMANLMRLYLSLLSWIGSWNIYAPTFNFLKFLIKVIQKPFSLLFEKYFNSHGAIYVKLNFRCQ